MDKIQEMWTEDNGLPSITQAGNPLPTLEQYKERVFPALLELFKEVIGDEPWVRYHAGAATAVAAAWSNFPHDPAVVFGVTPEWIKNIVPQIIE